MEVALIKPENVSVQIVQMANKPQMAVAMENVKLRDYPEDMRLTNCVNLVEWLLNLLGVNAKDQTDHHTELAKHIFSSHGKWTFQEIKLAFEMYVRGDFYENGKPMLVTQSVNAVVFGRVMRSYEEKKKSELDAYYRKKNAFKTPEMSLEEKRKYAIENLLLAHECFLESGKVEENYYTAFDTLIELKFLKPYQQFQNWYDLKKKNALVILQSEYRNKLKELDKNGKRQSKEYAETYREGARLTTESKAVEKLYKCLVLRDFFTKKNMNQAEFLKLVKDGI
ncbi:hypothetical protein [Joostella sp. CR20]|uniref:hypothetical protein n=1 Tax=Joostella sp. CR20 TaxID=2804312 RepID=UPI00313DB6DB